MTREAGEAKSERKVWELVRREGKIWTRVNEDIKAEEWKEYLMELLSGVENRVIRGKGRTRESQEEADLEEEEVRRMIEAMKDGKAMEIDGIPNEAWKYGEEMKKWAGACAIGFGRGKTSQKNGKRGSYCQSRKKEEE